MIAKKKKTINCPVLKRQLVVLEVVIIFSSPRKKLLKYDQFMVAFTGKRKTRLALYFNQFQEKRHCNRNTVLQSGFTPKKRSLLALCSEKETVSNSKVLQFQSLNVRRWTQAFPVDLNWTTFCATWCQCFLKLSNRLIILSKSG